MRKSRTHHVQRSVIGVAAAAVFAVAMIGWSSSASGAADKTIRTEGTEGFHANSKIFSNLRFSPGHSGVRSGGTIHVEHSDQTEEPHTLTVVDAADVPTTVEGVFDCGSPGTVCDEAFQAVGPQIVDDTQAQVVDVAGGSGFDARLDTVWLPAGTSIDVQVTAPPGSTLRYICAIHAWMQGEVRVS